MKAIETVLDLIGNTPIVSLKDDRLKYICKAEFLNPEAV